MPRLPAGLAPALAAIAELRAAGGDTSLLPPALAQDHMCSAISLLIAKFTAVKPR
jgi:hypothetical protein